MAKEELQLRGDWRGNRVEADHDMSGLDPSGHGPYRDMGHRH